MIRRIWLFLFGLAAAVAAGFLLWRIRGVLSPFVFGAVIAYLIQPLVKALERKGAPRAAAVLTAYISVTLVLAAVSVLVVPNIVRQLNAMLAALPEEARKVEDIIETAFQRYRRADLPETVKQVADQAVYRAEETLTALLDSTIEVILGALSKSMYFLLAPVIAYYLTRDYDAIKAKALDLLSPRARTKVVEVISDVDEALSGYVRGQVMLCIIVGALMTVGLWLLRVRFALVLGAVAGIFNVVPYIGPVVGAVPAFAVALFQSPWTLLYVAALVVLIQQLESGLLAPKVIGDSVGLHPITIIFVLLAGGELFGLLGVVAAVPVTAALKVVVSHLIRRHRPRA